jgi:hypothetical protein
MDGVYLAIIAGFFALTWGLTVLSGQLASPRSNTGKEQGR